MGESAPGFCSGRQYDDTQASGTIPEAVLGTIREGSTQGRAAVSWSGQDSIPWCRNAERHPCGHGGIKMLRIRAIGCRQVLVKVCQSSRCEAQPAGPNCLLANAGTGKSLHASLVFRSVTFRYVGSGLPDGILWLIICSASETNRNNCQGPSSRCIKRCVKRCIIRKRICARLGQGKRRLGLYQGDTS